MLGTGTQQGIGLAPDLMPQETSDRVVKLIQAHPRYQEDFADAIPVSVLVASEDRKARWLFGQAEVWPDLIRSLETPEEREFGRPNWHWIDGRWVREGMS